MRSHIPSIVDLGQVVDAHDQLHHWPEGDRIAGAIQSFFTKRLADGVSTGTINRQRASLSSIFSWAIKQDPPYYCGSNPVAKVKKTPESPARERYLTPDEAATLLDKMDDRYRLLLRAALHTCARRGGL